MKASDNPTLESVVPDPTLFCTAFKKNRFYVFTRREPDDSKVHEVDRDVFNEKPSKEDIISATEASGNFMSFHMFCTARFMFPRNLKVQFFATV